MHPLTPIMEKLAIPVWGVGPVTSLPELQEIYAKRVHHQRYPSFAPAPTAERWNPQLLLPDAVSVIVIAVPYYDKEPGGGQCPPEYEGGLARYAWGEDYHAVLHRKLESLGHELAASWGATVWRAAVDSAPLADRQLAVHYGMAAFGWNSCVFTKQYGSWVVLGSLLVDTALPPTAALAPDMPCGSPCRACLQACPTGALIEPYVLDPGRCLAYLTQAAGVFPREFRSRMGAAIWGCDICQSVCPVNQRASASPLSYFGAPEHRSLDLSQILSWTKQDFQAVLGRSAAAWRGRTVLQRNAALALGNIGSKTALPVLEKTLQHHGSAVVRASALWSLNRLDPRGTRSLNQVTWEKDADPIVKEEAAFWLQ